MGIIGKVIRGAFDLAGKMLGAQCFAAIATVALSIFLPYDIDITRTFNLIAFVAFVRAL